jgi:predicted  nucleic acid-binding Zn-ribbon protein
MANKQTTNEDLAHMIKKGFDDHDKRFDEIDNRFDAVDMRLEKMDVRMDNLEQGQEEIKTRVDNVAYRFEVDDLKKRVKKLEFKAGIRTT